FTLENTPGIEADLVICVGEVGAIAHQAARSGELTKFVDRGDGMPSRQFDELFTPGVEEWIGCHKECLGSQLAHRCESSVEIVFPARVQNNGRAGEGVSS